VKLDDIRDHLRRGVRMRHLLKWQYEERGWRCRACGARLYDRVPPDKCPKCEKGMGHEISAF